MPHFRPCPTQSSGLINEFLHRLALLGIFSKSLLPLLGPACFILKPPLSLLLSPTCLILKLPLSLFFTPDSVLTQHVHQPICEAGEGGGIILSSLSCPGLCEALGQAFFPGAPYGGGRGDTSGVNPFTHAITTCSSRNTARGVCMYCRCGVFHSELTAAAVFKIGS